MDEVQKINEDKFSIIKPVATEYSLSEIKKQVELLNQHKTETEATYLSTIQGYDAKIAELEALIQKAKDAGLTDEKTK